MTRIITVTSQKGGVAKTTTAVSIAHGLALREPYSPVLLVDFDPQGHAAIALGLDPEPGVFDLFVANAPADHLLRHIHERNIWLLPGNGRTRTADSVLRAESSAQQMIDRFTDEFTGMHDYIVIDTPAGGLFQEVAVRMATDLIIPVRCEALGLDGVAATLQLAHKVGNSPQIFILPTMFDKRLREHQINADLLRRNYPGSVIDPIPARIAVAEASAMGRTVWEANGAMADVQAAYTALLERLT